MRENYPTFDYWTHHLTDNATMREQLEDTPATIAVDRHPDRATDSFEGDTQRLLEALKNVGLKQVMAFDLSEPGLDVPVVRLVAPGLEGYYEFPYSKPHARATRYAVERAAGAGRTA